MLNNRGPNAHSELIFRTENVELLFSGFVLWQQGDELCQQPYTLKHHVLLINGDIFTKRGDDTKSDTQWLTEQIDECNNDEDNFFELFRNIEGPYSIVYLNKKTEDLYFIRDALGRQSLLIAQTTDGDLVLGSVLGLFLFIFRLSNLIIILILHRITKATIRKMHGASTIWNLSNGLIFAIHSPVSMATFS